MSYQTMVLWSMIDANGHLRHSAYADLGAQARIYELAQLGIDQEMFQRYKMGPVLFREETIYLREIKMNDVVTTTTQLSKARKDGSRFSFYHEIFRSDGIKAATINLDGAWLDLEKRKLMVPPADFQEKLQGLERAADFVESA